MTQDTTVWRPSVAQLRAALAHSARVEARAAGGAQQGWQSRFDEVVMGVAGVTGSVGATTVGLALASASTGPVRLVECSDPARSGLVAAAQREFGVGRSGWRRGEHGSVALLRRPPLDQPATSTLPPALDDETLTVLDVGSLAGAFSPEQDAAARLVDRWILVARPSVPCLRWLELSLALGLARDPVIAFVGPSPSWWPRPLIAAIQPRTRIVLDAGRHVTFRHDRRLAVSGLTPEPLPTSIADAGRRLLILLEGLPS